MSFYYNKKGPGTSFQSSELNQKHVGNACHDLHYPAAKSHIDTND